MLGFKQYITEVDESDEYFHITHAKNWSRIQKKGLIPKVGTRSKKLGEKPSIFLFKSRNDADDAMGNWLGDELGDEPAKLLKVKLPSNIKAHPTQAGYEHQVFEPIPPQHISVEEENY